MPRRSRIGRLDRSGGTNDESDEMNLMKNMGLAHSAWRVGSKMDWRGRLDRLDWLGVPNGYRTVWLDLWLRAGSQIVVPDPEENIISVYTC